MESNSSPSEQAPLPPTWDELRKEGLVVVDNKMLKLGVYAGAEGVVVFKFQDFDDLQAHHFFVEHWDTQRLIGALTKAHTVAASIAAEWGEEGDKRAQAEGATLNGR